MLPTTRRPATRPSARSPWEDPFYAMESRFGDLLRRLWEEAPGPQGERIGAYPVDIEEDENNVYVAAEMPGFTKDDVDVRFEGGMLTISGERKEEKREGTSHLTERRFNKVQRSFSLPSNIDESKVDATLKDGVLHITLPKQEEAKPRKISVK